MAGVVPVVPSDDVFNRFEEKAGFHIAPEQLRFLKIFVNDEKADASHVLRDGEVVSTLPTSELTTPSLIQLMVGRDLADHDPKKPVPVGEEILATATG